MSTAHVDQNSYNKGGMITFILSMIATFLMMIYVVFFSGGIDLKEIKPPASDKPAAEQPGAQPAEQAPAAEPAHSSSNALSPWISTAQAIERGQVIFKDNCASCHGDAGMGDGPMAKNLSPKPRNLIDGAWQQGGNRIGLYEVVSNGISGSAMIGYSHLESKDRWAVVHFIRSITHNKVADNDADVANYAATLN